MNNWFQTFCECSFYVVAAYTIKKNRECKVILLMWTENDFS